jgi:2,4-dienoyl-CoA reductase-like NADH-dependent reductase (Old Yellow Enzyme family)
MAAVYPRIGGHKTVAAFQQHLASLGLNLPVADHPLSAADGSSLARPLEVQGRMIGNRWCVHPMEGWDGETDGRPTDTMRRRWRNFGASGCKLIWGCEAFAIRPDGRANPRQLMHRPNDIEPLRDMLNGLRESHTSSFGASAADDLYVGLQLTHSGRFCKPSRNDRFESRVAYRHPVLDARVGVTSDDSVFRDEELPALIDAYVAAARTAQKVGFDFVDVKACHGYLMHEFLSGYTRPGKYGGDFEGRTRLLREVIAAVRTECPGLEIGVRLSLFDQPAFRPKPGEGDARKKGTGIPEAYTVEHYPAFGAKADNALEMDLTEPVQLLKRLRDDHGVRLFNISAGSPYYNPHIQRPAFYPPSDGYQPPEDPLAGCVRQIEAVRQVKLAVPDVILVGTAYSYFQEYLPHVAEAVVRDGWVDSVGIGRLVLSDWTLPAKVLRGEDYAADKKICRTFSDCTTAPRNGMISGCYPLDEFYKELPEAEQLKKLKAGK